MTRRGRDDRERSRVGEAWQARTEDLEDIQAAHEASGGEALPLAYARRIIMDEAPPVRVWREYRGLTVDALAERAGMEPGCLSEIEAGKKIATVDAYLKLAVALGTTFGALVAERGKAPTICFGS